MVQFGPQLFPLDEQTVLADTQPTCIALESLPS